MQSRAFDLFILVSAVLVAVFVWVALSTGHERQPSSETVGRLRGWFFAILAAGLAVAAVFLYPSVPYPKASDHPQRVIYAVGMQFSWGLSEQPITTPDEWLATTYAAPLNIPAGSSVEFRVTSFDVNHGFGVYSSSGRLLGQVQAMPGYTNRLRLRFPEPGKYWVLCLELCGMGHHRMRGEFEVVPGMPAGK